MGMIVEGETREADPLIDAASGLVLLLGQSEPMPVRPQDAPLLDGAEEFRFGPDGSRLAWSIGEGPLVPMVHGYGGRGLQMAGLARFLAEKGFRCVFFDAGGHGDSRRERVGFHTFIADVGALTKNLGEDIYAWVGHSAGGLGMMRSRAIHGVKATRYVCISAPLFPYVPLDTFRHKAGADEPVLDFVKPVLAEQFQTTWTALMSGEAYRPEEGVPLLAVYDRSDERVRHDDAEKIAALWPGTHIIKTEGYGHNRILRSPEAWEAVAEFLSA